jgi:tRNA threonylcarbamoyladenosine biosynthesis protein TsaE
MTTWLASEAQLEALAAAVGQCWRSCRRRRIVAALSGDLGAGKTAWVRALLRGLGHVGKVPSPTYTLLEDYAVDGLEVLHLDLYRLESDEDLENIGIRDWLGRENVWTFAEWPERAQAFAAACDLVLAFEIISADARRIDWRAQSPNGEKALTEINELLSSYQT